MAAKNLSDVKIELENAMQHQGQVVIGPDFFQKEIKNYSRLEFAWGREVGQNSIDAGAKNIVITVTQADTGCLVVWADDGCGMTLDILLNKFLTLGASHKRKGATGGFGWAKTLILFAQTNYRIHTGDTILTGCGGSYSYTTGNTIVDGCIVEVELPTSLTGIVGHIKKWAKWTDFNGAKIAVNGKSLKTFADANIEGKKQTGMDWLTMQVVNLADNQAEGDADIFYRINGQMMSTGYAPAGVKKHIVFDILGDSTKYFTANRDALQYDYRQEVSAFLTELYRDPRSIVKVKKPTRITMKGEKGALEIGVTDADRAERLQALLDNPEMLKAMLEADASAAGAVHEGFTCVVVNELSKNIPQKWMPGMWNKHAVKLMTRWCGIVMLVGQTVGYRGNIIPGWYFSTEAEAGWNHEEKSMLLNPVFINKTTGKMTNRFKLDNPGFVKMVVSAIHEFGHAAGYKYHNEDFITLTEGYMEKVMNKWAAFKTLRRSI